MITHEQVKSAETYAVGVAAMSLPAWVTFIEGWLQFATTLLGFLIVAAKAWYDFKRIQERRNVTRNGGSAPQDHPPSGV